MPIQWVAIYNDGTKLYQYNGEQEFKYSDIKRDKLAGFALLKGDTPLILFHLEEGQRLIYRKRHFLRFDGQRSHVYLVGWQKNVKGENVQSIACVFENGQIQIIGKWRDDILFREPELLSFEK